jgi:hypothetical protein
MTGSKGFEIIEKKRWLHEKGAVPCRIVLLKHFKRDGTIKEYSTHLECNRDGQQELYSGHYFDTVSSARKDFEKREA